MAAFAPTLSNRHAVVVRGILFAVASYGGFATADAVVKSLSGHYSLSQLAAAMAVFALLPVMALTIGRGGLQAIKPQKPGLVAARAVLTTLCMLSAWQAFSLLPLADAYAMLFAAPLLVTALAGPLLGEQVGWRRWLATGIGFLGVLVMIRPGFASLELGHAFGAAAAVFGACAFIVLRKIGPSEKSAAVLVPFFLTLIAVSGTMAWPNLQAFDVNHWPLIIVAGLLIGAGQTGLVFATRDVPAALVAPFQYTQMLWAIGFGIWLFGDVPDNTLFAGLVLVVGSGLYTLWREVVRNQPATLARGETPARDGRGPIKERK